MRYNHEKTTNQESEYEDDIIDMDDRPIECQACDSDCYPACKDGCPVMDDWNAKIALSIMKPILKRRVAKWKW